MSDFIFREPSYDFISEFEPIDNFFGNNEFTLLYTDIQDKLNRYDFIGGISILSNEGKQPFLIAKNDRIVEDYYTVKSIIASMKPKQFFDALDDFVVKDGLGHLKFDYFEIYFVKLDQNFSLSFFVINTNEYIIESLNSCLTSFQHVISMAQLEQDVKEPNNQMGVPSPDLTNELKNTNLKGVPQVKVNPEDEPSSRDNKQIKKKSKDQLVKDLRSKFKSLD